MICSYRSQAIHDGLVADDRQPPERLRNVEIGGAKGNKLSMWIQSLGRLKIALQSTRRSSAIIGMVEPENGTSCVACA